MWNEDSNNTAPRHTQQVEQHGNDKHSTEAGTNNPEQLQLEKRLAYDHLAAHHHHHHHVAHLPADQFLPSMAHRDQGKGAGAGFGDATNPLPPWSLMDQPDPDGKGVIETTQERLNRKRRLAEQEDSVVTSDVVTLHKRRHNLIEQRRRNKINQRIAELKAMIPQMYHAVTDKASKAQVLNDAILYVQDVQARLRILGVRDLVPDLAPPPDPAEPLHNPQPHPQLGPAAMAAAAASQLEVGGVQDQHLLQQQKQVPQMPHLVRGGGEFSGSPPLHLDEAKRRDLIKSQLANKGLAHQDKEGSEEEQDQGEGFHYSQEILRLLLSAAGKGDADNEPADLDPFGLEEGTAHFDDATLTHAPTTQKHVTHAAVKETARQPTQQNEATQSATQQGEETS